MGSTRRGRRRRAVLTLLGGGLAVSMVMTTTAWGQVMASTHTYITWPSNASAPFNSFTANISAYTTHDANTNGLSSGNYALKLRPYGWTQNCEHSDYHSSTTSSPSSGDIGSSGAPVTHTVTWDNAADPGTGSVCFSDEDAVDVDAASVPVAFTLV